MAQKETEMNDTDALVAWVQQRISCLEAAIKQLDNNDITAIKRLGGLEDRIAELEAWIKADGRVHNRDY